MLTWKFQRRSSSTLPLAGCVLWLCLGLAAPAVAQEPAQPAQDEQAPVEANEAAGASAAETADDQSDDQSADAPSGGASPAPQAAPPAAGGADGTDERTRQLEAYQQAFKHYSAQMEDYKSTIDAIVEAEYNRRVADIHDAYQGKISALEAVEQKRRVDAIAAFEEYLRRYPNTPGYTPDALFRLAELEFEKANADFLYADEVYQDQLLAYEAGTRADPPELPQRDFSRTGQLFERLVTDWPRYDQVDGALYLLAYVKLQMNEEDEARDLLATLVQQYPDSRFVPEAWVRIGEYWFSFADGADDLRQALHAYEQAIAYTDSDFYDKALYKLAWTYYRLDQFDRAITEFKRLVEYSDDQKMKTGRSGSVLRAEAVQYIAVSLAEPDWDLDGAVDDEFGLPRVQRYLTGEVAYEREVLVQLVEYMFDNTRYDVAQSVIRYAMERFPRHPENPQLHEKLILALTRDGRTDDAFIERGNLLAFYGPDSDWFAYQKRVGREEALRYGDNLVKDNLIQSATWFHEQAQNLRNEAIVRQDLQMLEEARERYGRAATAYADFLARFPNDKDIYQWNFYYAECLYYSGQYQPAYEQYKVVRELDLSQNMYQEKAAFNAIKSLEYDLKARVERGEIAGRGLSSDAADDARDAAQQQTDHAADPQAGDGQIVRMQPEPMPDLVHEYLTAIDRYVVLGLKNDGDPDLDIKFAFQAGKLVYDFKDYDDARKRFAWVVEKYPENELAYLSGSLILETYRQEQDYQNLAMWAERLSSVIKGDQAQAIQDEVRQFQLGAMFKSAEQLFQARKYDEAAAEYLRLVNNAPDHPYASKALNNAAVAYENVGKYESAMNLFERVYRDFPNDPLAGYALYRVAVNSDRFFDFDKAVQSYLLFYEKYEGQNPQMLRDMGFDMHARRQTALRSAAVLTENLQQYPQAGRLYEQYVRAYPQADDAESVQWQAVQSWKKAGDTRRMMDAIAAYRRNYGSSAARSGRVLEGMTMVADHYAETKNQKAALTWYRDIVQEFRTRGIAAGDPSAYYAAKAQFMLAEEDFQQWKKIEIKGNMKQQGKLLEKKIAEQAQVAQAFQSVFQFNSLEWTLAAYFRIGGIYEAFAESLYNVPIPFAEDSDEWYMYRDQLDDMVVPLEDKAVEFYEGAIQKAREERVVNDWTKRTLEQLNKYKPAEYPLFKEERREVAERSRSGNSFMGAGEYQARSAPVDPTHTPGEEMNTEDPGGLQ